MNDLTPQGLDAPMLDKLVLERLVADKMERHCREQLSAMLDGALPPDEARFLLRRLQHDHELAGCWERWQLCGDLMRGSAPALLPRDFAQRVAAALQAGNTASAAGRTSASERRRGWARWGGGMALAASVATAALFVSQREVAPPDPATPAPVQALASSNPAFPGTQDGQPSVPAPAAIDPATAVAAAVAAAATEIPRRTARRARPQAERPAPQVSVPAAQAPAMIAVSAGSEDAARVADVLPPASIAADPFAGDATASPRPWPRAVLPGLANAAFDAGYGAATQRSTFEPFAPQVPLESAEPGEDTP